MSREVPEPWASALMDAGLTDPRNGSRPSMRRLAEAVEVHASTISAMMYGDRSSHADLIQRVADALGRNVLEVSSWVGLARTEKRPFEPHPDASLLTTEERQAVNEVIRLMALPKKRRSQPGTEDAPTQLHPEVAEPPAKAAAQRPDRPRKRD